jgi:hypothetical protein
MLIGGAAVLIGGCDVARARTVGVNEGARFRQLLNAEKYSEIYASASTEFRRTVTERQWIASCAETQRKLGQWKGSTLKDSEVILVDSGGYIVNVNYATEFATGSAIELLSFFVIEGTPSLRLYNVSSPALTR